MTALLGLRASCLHQTISLHRKLVERDSGYATVRGFFPVLPITFLLLATTHLQPSIRTYKGTYHGR